MRSVFISYRHESTAHVSDVRSFAERLRGDRLPVEFDQFYLNSHPGGPDEGWPKWCCDRAANAECVLVIASPGWFQAYESQGPTGKGLGVAAEAQIFSQAIYRDRGISHRIRFVTLNALGDCEFPLTLDRWHKFDLPSRPEDYGQIVAWARQKLSISSPEQPPTRTVYLAECLIDDGMREGLREELRLAGWEVLPDPEKTQPDENDAYAANAAENMRRAIAFIQLLQKYPWKGASRDLIQNDQAVQIGIPRIRFRSPELDCATIQDDAHRNFLMSDPSVFSRPFDQFKKELSERLNELWDRVSQAPTPPGATLNPKLIRIIDRSINADANWARVFPWFDTQDGIIHDRIRNYDLNQTPLTIKQRTKPCQGFLIVCDSSALNDPSFSPDGPLDECQEIQLGYKDNTRCPPVGVVYWPPPPDADAWPRLLSFKPLKLHRVHGENHTASMTGFFNDVRRVLI